MTPEPWRRGLVLAAALFLAGCDARSAETIVGGDAETSDGQGFPAQTAAVQSGADFPCTPTKVWDGDGPIHCAEGPRIRLSGIAARESDGSCNPGHPCPTASAEAARNTLAGLLGRTTGTAPEGHLLLEGPALACRSVGSAGGKRTAAWCISPIRGDLSCAMVASGTVEKWDRYWRDHACG